jgi:hypothetical protein
VRTVDTLFVAMTRPSVKWGVPTEGFVVNFFVTFAVTVFLIHRPPGFLLGVFVHFALPRRSALLLALAAILPDQGALHDRRAMGRLPSPAVAGQNPPRR